MYSKSVIGLREVASDLESDAFGFPIDTGISDVVRAFKLRYLANMLDGETVNLNDLATLIDAIGDDVGPTLQTIVEETFYGVSADITASEFAKVLRVYAA